MRFVRIILLCLCLPLYAVEPSEPIPLDRIAAVVNSTIITENTLQRKVAMMQEELARNRLPSPDKATLSREVLERLIDEQVQLQVAEKQHIVIEEAKLTQTIESIAKQNQLSVPKFQEKIELQGIAYEQFRKDVRDQLIIQQLQQMVFSSEAKVSQEEIAAYIKQYGNTIDVSDVPTPLQKTAFQEKAREQVVQKKIEDALGAWLKQLRAQAYIRIWHE